MGDYITAWQCIGCGKIEAPQPCIGVCRDRKILLVGIDEHQQALDEVQRAYGQVQEMQAILSLLALSTPRPGQWEPSYRALQQQARSVLAKCDIADGNAAAADHVI